MYCKYCGKEMDKDAVLCVSCGRLTDDYTKKIQPEHPVIFSTLPQQQVVKPNTQPINTQPAVNNLAQSATLSNTESNPSKAWIYSTISIFFSVLVLVFAIIGNSGIYYTGSVLVANNSGDHNHLFIVGFFVWSIIAAWVSSITSAIFAGIGFNMARNNSKKSYNSPLHLLASLISLACIICTSLMTAFSAQ